jgi:ribosome-associated heat shock protein Hsp15
MASDRLRIDKWLWHARVVRTRTLAAALVGDGHVRLNGARIDAASKTVRPGDVVTIALERRVLVWKVLGVSERRGPASEAQALYEDISPPEPDRATTSPPPAPREPGTGRPTKQERRAVDRLLGRAAK